MGWLFWCKTATMPTPNVSYSTTNTIEKSGSYKTGAEVKASLSLLNEVVTSLVHENLCFRSNQVNGAAITPKSFMNLQ